MQRIDFMTGKKYIKDNNDIKIIMITPKGDMYLASRKYDNLSMQKDFNINVPREYDSCKTHVHYIQVLLHRYFKNNKLYKKLIENKDIFETVIDTTRQLVKDGFILFYNITDYEKLTFNEKKDFKIGLLNINHSKITKEQGQSLQELEKELKHFKTINIPEYLGPKFGFMDNYIKPNQIYNTIFRVKRKTR